MNRDLIDSLAKCETDLEGALRRFSGDEALYLQCLDQFLDDPTVEQLEISLDDELWDDAFTSAHALKGLAGNMGFIPLFHATGELVVLIRAGRISELNDSMQQIMRCYNEISSAIRRGLYAADKAVKGARE